MIDGCSRGCVWSGNYSSKVGPADLISDCWRKVETIHTHKPKRLLFTSWFISARIEPITEEWKCKVQGGIVCWIGRPLIFAPRLTLLDINHRLIWWLKKFVFPWCYLVFNGVVFQKPGQPFKKWLSDMNRFCNRVNLGQVFEAMRKTLGFSFSPFKLVVELEKLSSTWASPRCFLKLTWQRDIWWKIEREAVRATDGFNNFGLIWSLLVMVFVLLGTRLSSTDLKYFFCAWDTKSIINVCANWHSSHKILQNRCSQARKTAMLMGNSLLFFGCTEWNLSLKKSR